MNSKVKNLIPSIIALCAIITIAIFTLISSQFVWFKSFAIPFVIIYAVIMLLIFHTPYHKSTIILLVMLYLIAQIVFSVGVNSGVIFGNFVYGDNFGIILLKTPIIIGFLWLITTYSVAQLLSPFDIPLFSKSALGALMITIFDMNLQPIASKLNLWHWYSDVIPAQNYAAVYGLAFGMLILINKVKVNNKFENPIAPYLIGLMLLFFFMLNILM